MAALAVAIAWGRVYAGVHWPFDMAGGVLVGTAGALAAHLYGQRVTAPLERIGDSVHAVVMGRRHAP
ncbi:phosphatase PAP2 family protein, partial [Escherichia coli]|nr:phosphatase PAP2 family protein [Escherichia coli]